MQNKNILVIGEGAREDAIQETISKSSIPHKIFEYESWMENWDHHKESFIEYLKDFNIDLVVIGPEKFLEGGLADLVRSTGIAVVGPSRLAAKLETSKSFTRELCDKLKIPCPKYDVFKRGEETKMISYIENNFRMQDKVVFKQSGLCSGKGVEIIGDRERAINGGIDILGRTREELLVEECLEGREASFMFLCDGVNAIPFGVARDYKRLSSDPNSPMTGGMGAFSPVPDVTEDMCQFVRDKMVMPVLEDMQRNGTPFMGFLYVGVMITDNGIKLIEFNARLGDPEAQAILPRLKTDFLELLYLSSKINKLKDIELEWDENSCVAVVIASMGYPLFTDKYNYRYASGFREVKNTPNADIFFTGGLLKDKAHIVMGNKRAYTVIALGRDVVHARNAAYENVAKIKLEGMQYRHDIGL